jgi:predicted nucleic acid-binding protein
MIVVADTTPINYLILIEEIDVLPALYGRVVVPCAVSEELMCSRAPLKVREWMKQPPGWLEILSPPLLMPNLQSSTPESVRRLRWRRNYPQINSLSMNC